MSYPFSYTVVHIDHDNENSYLRESGMGIAQSYADAMVIIEDFYGEDLISVRKLELYEESPLIILPEQVTEDYAEASNDYNFPKVYCDAKGVSNEKGIFIDDTHNS